jgi:RNase P subunit RPR2
MSGISQRRILEHVEHMQRQILFKCPRTGMNVQHRFDDFSPERPEVEDVHVAVWCPACAWVHFIDSNTGKLLGDRRGRPTRADLNGDAGGAS